LPRRPDDVGGKVIVDKPSSIRVRRVPREKSNRIPFDKSILSMQKEAYALDCLIDLDPRLSVGKGAVVRAHVRDVCKRVGSKRISKAQALAIEQEERRLAEKRDLDAKRVASKRSALASSKDNGVRSKPPAKGVRSKPPAQIRNPPPIPPAVSTPVDPWLADEPSRCNVCRKWVCVGACPGRTTIVPVADWTVEQRIAAETPKARPAPEGKKKNKKKGK